MNHGHHCGEMNNNLMPLEWLQLSPPMVRQTHVIMVIGHMDKKPDDTILLTPLDYFVSVSKHHSH